MATKIVDVKKSNAEHAKLPNTQTVLHVEHTDEDTGLIVAGEFTIKRLNLGDMRQVGLRRAQLNGGMSEDALDEIVVSLNAMLAHLEGAIVKAPEWWQPDNFYSGDLVALVYGEVLNFEATFRVSARERQGADKGSGSAQPGQPDGADAATPVVDAQVPAPPNP